MALSDEEFKARRDAALFKLESAANIWHRYVTYDETQDVPTATGPIPSLRKVIAQIRAEESEVIDPAMMELVDIIKGSVDEPSDFLPPAENP